MAMNSKALKRDGKVMLDYIGDYWDNIRDSSPLHSVEPGYLTAPGVLPVDAPETPDTIHDILNDVDKHILPGVTQWQHPNFHAYFPTTSSYPSLLADMLSGATGIVGHSWNASPACTELEALMMNWLGGLLQLPKSFLNIPGQPGGGVIQGTASEATLIALLAARNKKLKEVDSSAESSGKITKLVCYSSDQAHSCTEKAALIAHVKLRSLPTDSKFSLRGETRRKAIGEDRKQGLMPFLVVGTAGTTGLTAYDNLSEIGQICEKEAMWFHVDAAYAGAAAICPEYRYFLDGVENADSFNVNIHKWMMVNFDCSVLWMKDCYQVADEFNVEPSYLQHERDQFARDFKHLPTSPNKRFRSLKLWFSFRLLGAKAIQDNIRNQIALAKEFEKLVRGDEQYEIIGEVTVGLVCFRLKESNAANKALNARINNVDKRIHLVPSQAGDTYYLRLAICSTKTTSKDMKFAWRVIQECTQAVKAKYNGHYNGYCD